jgi:iron complex outermembrane receptor protein
MRTSVSVYLGLVLSGLSSMLFAQEQTTQPTLVVTADRFESELQQAPANVSVVTRAEIDTSGVTTLSQALQTLGHVNISGLFGITGARARVDMGGFGASGGQNTLILLNGRRLNDVDLSGANLSAIPLETVERIEILRGSATVLYGDNAVGGVINIITRSGFDADISTASITAGGFGATGIGAVLSRQKGDLAFYLAADIGHSDGYRDNSAFDNGNIMTELARQTSTGAYGLRAMTNREDLRLPGYLNEPDYLANPKAALGTTEFANQTGETYEGFYNGNRWRGELAYRNKQQNAVIFGDTEANLKTLSFTPRYRTSIGRNKIVSGVDFYHSALNTLADFTAYGGDTNQSHATRGSYALYASDNIKLNDSYTLNLGGRYQSVDLQIDNTNITTPSTASDSRTDALTAWETALNYHHSKQARSYLRLAQSVRFPVLDEMWSYYSGTISLLRPQYGEHLEAGTQFPLSDDARFEANLFYIRLKDEIGYVDATASNVNLDPTRHQGLNLGIQAQLNQRWKSRLGYSYRDAVFSSGTYAGNNVPEVPLHSATWNNTYTTGKAGTISLNAVYIGERFFGDDLDNVGKQMPAYLRWDLAWIYRKRGWDLSVSVNNLTNIKTADRGYYAWWSANPYMYYPLPERSVLVKLRAQL